MNRSILITFIIVLLSTSCLNKKFLKEQEHLQILDFISELNLDFYTTKSGFFYHIEYEGNGNKISEDDSVILIYNGYNLDKQEYFVKNDTFKFVFGQSKIHKAWQEVLPLCSYGAVGILIIPYYLGFRNEYLPNVPPNSTLVFYFRILAKDKFTNSLSSFYEYTELNRSEFDFIYENLIFVHTIFYGIGVPAKNNDSATIEYQTRTLYDTIFFDQNTNFKFAFDDTEVVAGLRKSVALLNEGTMADVYVSPALGYGQNPPFDIPEYSPLVFRIRVLSNDPNVKQDSEIKKYFFINNIQNPDTLNNGVILIDSTISQMSSNPKPQINDTLIITYNEKIINQSFSVNYCDNCKLALNNNNFVSGLTYALQTMPEGSKAYFIVPYQIAYGENGSGAIPPYATMLYYVELNQIIKH